MRRSRFRVLRDILSATKEPSTKTSIVYEANLSFKQAKKYLALLEKNDLVESHKSEHKKFEVTEKGRNFLKTFEKLNELISVT